MNSAQLINYVQAHTGRRLYLTQLSLYINKGWLNVNEIATNSKQRYTMNAANEFVRYLTSWDLTQAASEMTKRLGEKITTGRINDLCKADKIVHIGKPYRIPDDSLSILEDQLRLQQGIPSHVALAVINACLQKMSGAELARRCKCSESYISLLKNDERNMQPEMYDKLLEISQGENDE
jgi:transcriptional regulator with XRE-family HTH domain